MTNTIAFAGVHTQSTHVFEWLGGLLGPEAKAGNRTSSDKLPRQESVWLGIWCGHLVLTLRLWY